MTGVYLEIGKRKVFACARDWPGWARAGRGEDAALVALTAAAPRFAVVCARAGVPFDGPSAVAHVEIVERVAGSATTDFGALDVCADLDRAPLTRQDAGRLAALVEAAWNVFGQAASAAPRRCARARAAAAGTGTRSWIMCCRPRCSTRACSACRTGPSRPVTQPRPPACARTSSRPSWPVSHPASPVPRVARDLRVSSRAVPPGTRSTTPGRSRTGKTRPNLQHPLLPHRARQVRRDLSNGGRAVGWQHRRARRPTATSRIVTPHRVEGRHRATPISSITLSNGVTQGEHAPSRLIERAGGMARRWSA